MSHRPLFARATDIRVLIPIVSVAFSLLFSASLFAQATGKIEGTIADSTQAVVPGAR
jgi:hypothetical protein